MLAQFDAKCGRLTTDGPEGAYIVGKIHSKVQITSTEKGKFRISWKDIYEHGETRIVEDKTREFEADFVDCQLLPGSNDKVFLLHDTRLPKGNTDDLIIAPHNYGKKDSDSLYKGLQEIVADLKTAKAQQNPSPDADKDLIKKVNDAPNKPATSRPSGAATTSGSGSERPSAGGTSAAAAGAQDFNGMGGLDQSQLMSLFQSLQGNESMAALTSSGGGGSSTAAATAGTEAASSEADCEPTGESTSSSNPLSLDNPVIQMAFSNLAKKEARGLKKAADTLGTALQTAQLRPMDPTVLEAADEGSLLRFAREMTSTEGGHHVEDSSTKSGVPKTPSPKPEDEDVAREPEPKRNRPDDKDDKDVE